ncbi:hypothetical protein [Cohnella fermenti]|uniref:Uncharacterized protein n=1 Tax=Cohnella fermenti TaxID=2565925 RepID=A0A4S4C1V8_9BACL|nr:hypothetical protein [Cohnella fermenti]THF79539.1 hypothetical protein E6C55_12210 [Cohnella fermenti]
MQPFLNRWQVRREQGKQKFVLRYGFLAIGVSAVVLFSIFDVVFNGNISFTYLLGRLVMFPSVGAIVAGLLWERNEKKYAKLLTDSQK